MLFRSVSRIGREFGETDQRRYYVPCPCCGHQDFLTWDGQDRIGKAPGLHHAIAWEEDQPETARLRCAGCGELIEERYQTDLLSRGEWRPTAEGKDPLTRGYHLSALYSPSGWKSWAECASEFERAKRDPSLLKVWVNTSLGEEWEERGTSVDPESLLARVEKYVAEVPTGVGVLVAAVDVQDNRLEVQVKGYGAGEESWLIAYEQIPGDPGQLAVWSELDVFLRTRFRHESGQEQTIECTTEYSGGHHTDYVYRY